MTCCSRNFMLSFKVLQVRNFTKLSPFQFCRNRDLPKQPNYGRPDQIRKHSLGPNTQYVALTGKNHMCVKLKLIKTIQKNDELTVFNRENFFVEGNWDCQCQLSEMHVECPFIFSNKQLQLISANSKKRRCVRLNVGKQRNETLKKMRSEEMCIFTE